MPEALTTRRKIDGSIYIHKIHYINYIFTDGYKFYRRIYPNCKYYSNYSDNFDVYGDKVNSLRTELLGEFKSSL